MLENGDLILSVKIQKWGRLSRHLLVTIAMWPSFGRLHLSCHGRRWRLAQSPEDFFEDGKVYDLYRYAQIDQEEVKKRAESLLGAPYNASFYPDGDGYYCSQFIAELLPILKPFP